MGATKYPVMDEDFSLKVIGACRDSEERGLMRILLLTGMHISCLSSGGTTPRIVKRGTRTVIEWSRPKTRKTLSVQIPNPKDEIEDIMIFLETRRKSKRHYQNIIRDIGERAGFELISPNTFRHTKCISLLRDGWHPVEVAHFLGCTLDVVVRNYSQLRDDQRIQGAD